MSSALNHVPSCSGIRPLKSVKYFPTSYGLAQPFVRASAHSVTFTTSGNQATSKTKPGSPQQHDQGKQDASCNMRSHVRSCSREDSHLVHHTEHESQWLGSCQEQKRPLKPAMPTKYLLSALHRTGCELDNVNSTDSSAANATPRREHKRNRSHNTHRRPRLSFQVIVADYLQYVEPLMAQSHASGLDDDLPVSPQLDDALENTFTPEHIGYLTNRGYSVTDVAAWAWILQSDSTYQAILRLLVLEEDYRVKHGLAGLAVPPFLPLFLLRQPILDARTFRLLVIYCLHLIGGQPPPSLYFIEGLVCDDAVSDVSWFHRCGKSSMEPSTCADLVVRLLRHSRLVWPQVQLPIARAYAQYLNNLTIDERSISKRKTPGDAAALCDRFKTRKFNRLLWLLSLPSKPNPFILVSVQQQAQFETLKAMASHKPVIPVERLGYQGITAVQLAHRKTSAEKQSAELKAPSWPPWKEDRLGIDSERGIEGMESRAMQVIHQMAGAGYSRTRWEEVASILAGWDTDRSPTIQTRAFMHRPRSLRTLGPSAPDQEVIWTARIRATRTVREAWACFLSYQDQGFPPRPGIYAAMAEKLIYRRKAVQESFDRKTLALPGDCQEVFPEPASARDVIYVRAEPPTLDEFLKQMLYHGVRPSGRFLSLLLRFAPTLNSGLDYLRCSDLPSAQAKALCSIPCQTSRDTVTDVGILREIHIYIFTAFINFLCNTSDFDSLYRAGHDISMADLFPVIAGGAEETPLKVTTLFQHAEASARNGEDIPHPRTLYHAVQLMRLRKTTYTPAWTSLLSYLSRDRISFKIHRSIQRIFAWHEILEVSEWMEELHVDSGFEGFLYLCQSFSSAVVAGIVHPDLAERSTGIIKKSTSKRAHETFEDMVHDGLRFLKGHFDKLVLPDPHFTPGPGNLALPMLHVPFPAALHTFIRALGIAEDGEGLLNLLRWMSQSAATLKDFSDEMTNGERMLRRCLIAVRVFLEGSWTRKPWSPSVINPTWSSPFKHGFTSGSTARYADGDDSAPIFSDPTVQEAFDIIEATPEWDCWPTDDEVQEYMYEHEDGVKTYL